jgi:hypothetical protein
MPRKTRDSAAETTEDRKTRTGIAQAGRRTVLSWRSTTTREVAVARVYSHLPTRPRLGFTHKRMSHRIYHQWKVPFWIPADSNHELWTMVIADEVAAKHISPTVAVTSETRKNDAAERIMNQWMIGTATMMHQSKLSMAVRLWVGTIVSDEASSAGFSEPKTDSSLSAGRRHQPHLITFFCSIYTSKRAHLSEFWRTKTIVHNIVCLLVGLGFCLAFHATSVNYPEVDTYLS